MSVCVCLCVSLCVWYVCGMYVHVCGMCVHVCVCLCVFTGMHAYVYFFLSRHPKLFTMANKM